MYDLQVVYTQWKLYFGRMPSPSCIYIILNLAVGGSWVGNPSDETSFENNPYVIDYIRVYQKDS